MLYLPSGKPKAIEMQKDFNTISNIQVGDSSFSSNELAQADFDLVKINESHYHILLGESSIEAECVYANLDTKEIHLRIEGILYKAKIQNNLDELVKNLGFDSKNESREKDVKAPMPGLVLQLLVEPGQTVSEGQDLLILEAMKMENIIQAPKDGEIEHIEVSNGDAVEKNQVLISYKDE